MAYILLIVFMTSDGIGLQHVGKSTVLAQMPIGTPVTLKTLCIPARGHAQ
jgi:hypothetical protein